MYLLQLKNQIISTYLKARVEKCHYILNNNIPLHF